MDDFYGFISKHYMGLSWLFFVTAMLSIPFEWMLMSVMKRSRPGIEDEIEKTVYGKGIQGKYKAMLEVVKDHPPGGWFMIGVVLERWLRIVSVMGFVFVMVVTYLAVST